MEDYCTFEQSVALKEMGFDWKCRGSYHDLSGFKESAYIHNFNNSKRYSDNMCSAPTLAQAAKWIRDKGLYIHVYLHLDDCWRFELQDVNYIDKYIYEPEVGLWWKTYEKALSAGIDQALELLTDKTEKK